MDRSRPRDFVEQLPRRTVAEVEFRDLVEDKQSLFHESWASYATRMAYDQRRVAEQHEKWATETWAEYEARSVVRHAALSRYFDHQHAVEMEASRQLQSIGEQSAALISRLMARESLITKEKLASIHTLFVDFDERQHLKMTAERGEVEQREGEQRSLNERLEADARANVELLAAVGAKQVQELLEAQRRAREEEERRLLEEQRRKAEELRLLEEARKREAEAHERARREAEEEAKRAERKRREEERKNKAKAEREARAKQSRSEQDETAQSAEEKKAPQPVADGKPRSDETDVPRSAVPALAAATPVLATHVFPDVAGTTVAALFASLTASLCTLANAQAYVMRISESSSLVVAHNGSSFGLKRREGGYLVGLSVDSPQSISIASQRLHSAERPDSVSDFVARRCEQIEDVTQDERCTPFRGAKIRESLFLVPMDVAGGYGRYVVGVSRQGDVLISPELTSAVVNVVLKANDLLLLALRRHEHTVLSQQALDWLAVTTACKNCYVALADDPRAPNVLTFVAATSVQRFLVGTSFSREEEVASKQGVSFALIDESIKTGQPEVAHISDIQDKTTNKVNSNEVRCFGTAKREGSLLLCPLIRPTQPETGAVFGVIYADTMGFEKSFNKADEDIMRTTAALLADLLEGSSAPPVSHKLAIETEFAGAGAAVETPFKFLKHVWLKVNTDISMITSGQLQELAKYTSPPPIIPLTVAATLLVALGTHPKNVEQWEDARKRVKPSLIEKIVAFDPTDATKRKKAFFTRASKITDGLSAHDVFTRGSLPASCFFTWTFVTILLRKSSDALRKALAAGASNVPVEMMGDAVEELDAAETTEVEGDDIPNTPGEGRGADDDE